jgi:hypothetical protein
MARLSSKTSYTFYSLLKMNIGEKTEAKAWDRHCHLESDRASLAVSFFPLSFAKTISNVGICYPKQVLCLK